MKYNMNFYDILLRYVTGYFVVMIGFVLQQVWFMLLGVPFILVGLLGISPLFLILGIDHNNFETHKVNTTTTQKRKPKAYKQLKSLSNS